MMQSDLRTILVYFPSGRCVRFVRDAVSDCCPGCGTPGFALGLGPDEEGIIRLRTPAAGTVDGACPVCSLSLEWERVFDESQVLEAFADQRDWVTARTAWVMMAGRTLPICKQLKRIGRFPEFLGDVDFDIPPTIKAIASGDRSFLETVPHGSAEVIQAADHDGWTALHWAAAIGSAELVERLLRIGSVPDARTVRGETPLMLAAALVAEPDVMHVLLRASADLSATTTAGYENPFELDECGCSGRVGAKRTALHFAVESASSDGVKALLNAGADPNLADDNSTTPLMLAPTAGVVRSLVEHGARVDAADDRTLQAVHHAALHGDGEALEELIRCGADPHASTNARTGQTVLTCAIARREGKDCVGLIDQLVRAGVGVNEPAADKMLPLEYAARQSDARVVERLLALGAEVDAQGYRGTYALHSSLNDCKGDQSRITSLLLQAGADANRQDFAHNTPLILACSHRLSVNRIRMLVGAGADVNARGRYGMTALHHACSSNREDMVAALLSAGADPSIVDSKGRCPLDLAKSDAVRVLIKR